MLSDTAPGRYDLLVRLAGLHGGISVLRLGRRLAQFSGRSHEGFRFLVHADPKRGHRYSVKSEG